MKNSKLIALLRTFNSSELLQFRDFVASPYFNKNQELVLLYAYLKKLAPAFNPKKIDRIYAYSKLFPDRAYDDKHMKYLMSFLAKLAEQYIGHSFYSQQETLPEFHILSSLIDRKLDKHYNYIYSKTKTRLERSPLRNLDHYYQGYLLANTSNKYFSKKLVRKFDDSLQKASDNFDLYFLGNKLKYLCEMVNRGRLISADYKLNMMDEITQYLSLHPKPENPPISVYYHILLMLTEQDADSEFKVIKTLLDEIEGYFSQTEMQEIYQYALNFCIRRINSGQPQYLNESLELYMKGIDSGVMFTDGFLSPWAYKNVIGASLRLKKYDWVEEFIRNYNSSLEEGFQKNAFHYNLADLNFYKKDFDQALEHLNQVEYTDIYINLDSKKLLLKIYYEAEEEEALISLLAAFNIFLKRNKMIPSKVKQHYLNFHTILYILSKRNQKQLSTVQKRLDSMESVADRRWLIRSYESLIA